MPDAQTQPTATPAGDGEAPPVTEPSPAAEPQLLESDLLVEDVSIDGMCGVY